MIDRMIELGVDVMAYSNMPVLIEMDGAPTYITPELIEAIQEGRTNGPIP